MEACSDPACGVCIPAVRRVCPPGTTFFITGFDYFGLDLEPSAPEEPAERLAPQLHN